MGFMLDGRIVRTGMVAGFVTVLYIILNLGFGHAGFSPRLAHLLAYLIVVAVQFALLRIFAFRSADRLGAQFARYFLSIGFVGTISLLAQFMFAEVTWFTAIFNVVLISALNLVSYRFFVFSDVYKDT